MGEILELSVTFGREWRHGCFWTVVLEKTLESPLDCKEIQPVHSEGDQPWVFIGRTDVEAETPILWPPDAKSWRIWKDPDAGEDWGQEEKGTTEDEMLRRRLLLDGHGFGWTSGVGDGQGGLPCWGSWVAESDTTEWLNWTNYLYNGIPFHLKREESRTHATTCMNFEDFMLSKVNQLQKRSVLCESIYMRYLN